MISLLLPFIDVLTDHIFAIQNMIQNNSPAVEAVGCALLNYLILGPMLFSNFNLFSKIAPELFTFLQIFKVAVYDSDIRYDLA